MNWSSPIAPPGAGLIALLEELDAELELELDVGGAVSRAGEILPIGAVITSVFLPAALCESAVGLHPRPVGCPGD